MSKVDEVVCLYENDTYKVVIGDGELDPTHNGIRIYKVINKATAMVEYEDFLLPAAITAALRSHQAMEALDKDSRPEVPPKLVLQ